MFSVGDGEAYVFVGGSATNLSVYSTIIGLKRAIESDRSLIDPNWLALHGGRIRIFDLYLKR